MAKWSPAQQAAHERNWKIFNLRGLWYAVARATNPERCKAMQEMIDQELIELGAEPETGRVAARLKELLDA